MKKEIIRCERCNEILVPKRVKWLELSNTDSNYYSTSKFPKGHISQGCFSFGTTCATIELKETIKNITKGEILPSDVIKDIIKLCDCQIPYYTYRDNEAACNMAQRLNRIRIIISQSQPKEDEIET